MNAYPYLRKMPVRKVLTAFYFFEILEKNEKINREIKM